VTLQHGEYDAVGPLACRGDIAAESLTVPAKLLMLVTLIQNVAVDPACMLALVGAAEMRKSTTLIVRVVELETDSLVPNTVIV